MQPVFSHKVYKTESDNSKCSLLVEIEKAIKTVSSSSSSFFFFFFNKEKVTINDTPSQLTKHIRTQLLLSLLQIVF